MIREDLQNSLGSVRHLVPEPRERDKGYYMIGVGFCGCASREITNLGLDVLTRQ
jgi:hypothetical protein